MQTVFTGKEVKELMKKAIGGFYFKNFCGIPTDFLKEMNVCESGICADLGKCVSLNIDILDKEEFTNYAIAGEDGNETEEGLQEVWDGSKFFDYHFEICGYDICFNTTDKGNEITWEQFAELISTERFSGVDVRSVDGGSVYFDLTDSKVDVREDVIEVYANNTELSLDKSIIDAIYNDAFESEVICYRLEFNNGMADVCFEISHRLKNF